MDRREFCSALAAFGAFGPVLSSAQTGSQVVEKGATAPVTDTVPMNQSRVFRFSDMPVKQNANGGWSRAILHGTLPTGEVVESHETMLPPGQMPHPAHQHRNTEFVLIRQGQLEYLNEGKPEPAGPGDVIYTASNRMHGLKNVGTTDAIYFIVSVSRGQL